MLLKDLAGSGRWRAVGLLDDDAAKQGGAIAGVKVLGVLDDVRAAAARFGVTQAIIAMPGATHGARKRALDLCTGAGLSVMTVPALSDIVSGKVSVSALRNVELDDLLGRDPVKLDDAGLHGLLGGKRVLVTGAGGSIGSELCRQIARFAPRELILFEISEFALYSIEQEFRDRHPELAVAALIGDAKSPARVGEVFARHAPQVVFHAAAYKHVPLMEQGNAAEAVANNVLSTVTLARAAEAAGVEKFVLVSTDKAVNPTNVMGASKRLAEMLLQAEQAGSRTEFVIVRFGNVLGSTGSVIPRFREQIARGGPVTVTHPEIERYFMSIPEAAQLVLQAGLMGKGGRDLRARHGRAGQDRRPGAAADPALGLRRGRHPDRVHRLAAGREALRGAARRRRAHAADAASQAACRASGVAGERRAGRGGAGLARRAAGHFAGGGARAAQGLDFGVRPGA